MNKQLADFTKESLIEELTNLTNLTEAEVEKSLEGKVSEEEAVDKMDDAGYEARNQFLSSLLDGKKVHSLFPSEFTVYAQTWEERTELIEQALAIGFKNISTYEPLSHNEAGETTKDPNGNYAVNISSSESLIFGEHSNKMMSFFKEMVDVVKSKVVYTYCHNGDYRLHFTDEKAAMTLHRALTKFYEDGKSYAESKGRTLGFKVTHRKHQLDQIVVCINIS